MAAVLERPDPLAAQPARPVERRGKSPLPDPDELVVEQLSRFARNRGNRVRALVHVRTEHDHGFCPFHLAESGRPADMACLRALPRSYQVTPGRPRPATSDTAKASQAQAADSVKLESAPPPVRASSRG